jgi:hypothetical protein
VLIQEAAVTPPLRRVLRDAGDDWLLAGASSCTIMRSAR